MPGVHSVLTHKDVRGKNRIFGFLLYPWTKGDGYDRPILCDEKVFQYGDAIAVVCADTEEHARAAAEQVKVDLEPLPAYMNAIEAAADDALQIHPGTPNVFFEQALKKGDDTGPIMAAAAHVAEDSFYVQRQPHLPMESDVGFAYLDDDGRVTIQSKSISLYTYAAMIKEGLGLEADKLRLIQNPMGGSFGYKLSPTLEAILAAAVLATGRPCALRHDYFQQITYTGKRSPVFCDLKMAADERGKLLAMEWDFLMDHGAYSEFGDLLTVKICRNIGACYDIASIDGRGRRPLPTTPSARRFAATVRRKRSSPPRCSSTSWRRRPASIRWSSATSMCTGRDRPHHRRRTRRASAARAAGHDAAQVPRGPGARPA